MVGTVIGTTLLAVIVTKLVDLARKLDPGDALPKATWIVLSMVFGVAIALIWQIDALGELGISASSRLQGIAGQVLTGILVGGFGSGWHEVFDALSSSAKSSRANAAQSVGFSESQQKKRVWGT